MESPTGIIPEELMYPQKLAEVMELLQNTPGGSHEKLAVFYGWAKTVGVKLSPAQRNNVARTGDDYL
jgi:hypothetical protein